MSALAPDEAGASPVRSTLPQKSALHSAGQAIDMVLEVNADWCDENGIKVGDEIKL